MRQARRTVSLWQNLAAEQASSVSGGHDLARLSDAASHLGLAASRYGELGTAAQAWELSRRVAEQDLGGDQSRMARADNNLAALAAERGHGRHASDLITKVLRTRLALLEAQPGDAASWRRLTVSARTRADITRINGQVVEGVRLAAGLLADRQTRLGDPGHADIAEAQMLLGQALLAAGHPAAARRQLEEAADMRRARFLPASHRVQEDLIWLAKAALVLDHPRTVLDLLADQAAETDWFRDRISFRLGFTARRLLALARGRLGSTDEATAALLADRERLGGCPLDAGLDPLLADFDRSLGELALIGTRAQLARGADALAELARVEAEASDAEARPPLPAHGWTLVLLGRAAGRLGDAERAEECFRRVTSLPGEGIDPLHPVILTAHYHEAVRCADIGDIRQAARLLEPLLDRTLLDHGRPALGEAHPVLAGARALAERLGVTVPYTTTGLDEASLDIDA